MYNKLFITFFSVCIYITTSFFSHPIKLTSSLIKYNKISKIITIECKVFIDDFAPALDQTLEKKILDLKLSKEDLVIIENYFESKYKIFINGDKLFLKLNEYKVKENVMTLLLSINNIDLKKGDKLNIENELLFEKFEDLQSNWMTIQILPFIRNDNFESNIDNFSYSQIF